MNYPPHEMNLRAVFHFLAYCLDDRRPVPKTIGEINWEQLYDFGTTQTIVGLLFHGIQRLPQEQLHGLSQDTLLTYFATYEQIKNYNIRLNEEAVRLSAQLTADGFPNCILKGQGNALCYPDPYSRVAGDIDVWVQGKRRDIVAYARRSAPDARAIYNHVDYPVLDDIEVELHYIPAICNNWFYRRRLMRWYAEQEAMQSNHFADLPGGAGRIPVPTASFNRIYQLLHIMHHFFDEGIGIRQLIDYYYLLRQGFTPEEREADVRTLRHLGLLKFAGAVMFVEHSVLRLDEAYLLVPPDEERGRTLIAEILQGGNFGWNYGLKLHSKPRKFFLKVRRNMRFVRQFPAEALSEPLFRTRHFFWRLIH